VQPNMLWRRSVTGFKPRAKQPAGRETCQSFSEEELLPAPASKEFKIDTMPQSHDNTHVKSPRSSSGVTIEQYILSKKKAACNNEIPWSPLQSLYQRGAATTQVTSDSTICTTLTVSAQDKAYSYLFQKLAGNCHGLNLITYPVSVSGDEDGNNSALSFSGPTCVSIAAVVYVKAGTACHDWKSTELGLKHIFENAAEKNHSQNNATAWQFEGVVFEVWEAA
jgi:hypothetical protein